jgi:ABC-type multidrug transport system fused ATPase/permease subunit
MTRLMLGRTSLVVAHRLSTLRMATRILVLAGGAVVGVGRHDELLGRVPLYQRMWDAQMVPETADDSEIWSPRAATLAKDDA